MLRTSHTLHKFIDVNFISNLVCNQCVRWRRKPRWLPVAKSKVFRVPERIKIPEEERVELMRLHNNYKTEIRAIRRYLIDEIAKTTSTSEVAQLVARTEEEEHVKCMKENDEWNTKVALIRERRLAEQAVASKEAIINRLIAREEFEQTQFEKIEQIVREEKLKAHTFITAENIDRVIEEALANPVDPNFAIDLGGNVYRGRDTQPDNIPEEQREKIQVSTSS